jgi:hypothetical protein
MPAEYRTRDVPTRRRKRGRPTARAASTLGDRKALDLASDEEERIETKVSSPLYHIGKHVLICDATELLGANLLITQCQAFSQDSQQESGQAGSGGIFPAGVYPPPPPPPLSLSVVLTATLPLLPPLPLIPTYLLLPLVLSLPPPWHLCLPECV